MSSQELTTTCAAKQWQCEPQRIGNFSFKSNPAKRLAVLAPFFQLERKVLLLSKVLPCSNMGPSTKGMLADIWQLRHRMELPAEYAAAGISHIEPVVVIMFTPPCVLNQLSTHARKTSAGPASQLAYRKVSDEYYVAAADFHRRLVAAHHNKHHGDGSDDGGSGDGGSGGNGGGGGDGGGGGSGGGSGTARAVVVNYADLLWRRAGLVGLLQRALPCLGKLNAAYVPRLGVDVFRENRFKSRGSIASYAKNHDPVACCGYNVSAGLCAGSSPGEDEQEVLAAAQQEMHYAVGAAGSAGSTSISSTSTSGGGTSSTSVVVASALAYLEAQAALELRLAGEGDGRSGAPSNATDANATHVS